MNSTHSEGGMDRRRFLELAATTSGTLLVSGLAGCASAGARAAGRRGTGANGFSTEGLAHVHDVMAGYVERGLLPGMVTLVSRGGDVHVDAIGTKAVGGSDPMRRDTIFRIASMTKPVTAAATMILVEEGALDLAFMVFPLAEGPFTALQLLRDPFVLLVPADDPLAARGEPVSLREVAELPLITYRSDARVPEFLRSRGLDPRIVFRSDDNWTVHGLVAAGVGAAIVPRLGVDPNHAGVAAVDLAGRVPPRLVGVAWHADRYRSPAAAAFVETARAACAGLYGG
jgi:hypothetical protein